MKITKKHIGKKVTYPSWESDIYPWAIVKEVTTIGFVGQYINNDGKPNVRFFEYNNFSQPFSFYKEKKKELFDFNRFGCNAEHVRDLISVLDKRYKRK